MKDFGISLLFLSLAFALTTKGILIDKESAFFSFMGAVCLYSGVYIPFVHKWIVKWVYGDNEDI